ncbi:MAG TPA: hypothetical protein VFJ98_04500 [Mycobacteriales bacterium]|nr:hypothetical protein [Mycobacteriales bacterium]
MTTLVVLGAVVLLLVVYAFWTARRLDRLHARLDAAAAALDAQLHARAESAARFAAETDQLPRPVAGELARVASVAAGATGLGHDRELVENVLSRALMTAGEAAPDVVRRGAGGAVLVDTVTRASFARRFHNDAVRDALVVRRRRIVRYLHLAGRAPLPAYFEMAEPTFVMSEVAAAAPPYD